MPHEIADTSFVFPDFAMTEYRTPRQVIEAANAPHNYITKVGRGRSFIFRPRPTVPLFTVGERPGAEFTDTSKNDAEPIYNRALVLGTGEAGRPVEVERWAGQQPDVPGELVATPGLQNPSFETNTFGWEELGSGSITRDTAVFDTPPASLRWDEAMLALGGRVQASLMIGTWKKGVAYRLSLRVRLPIADRWWILRLGAFDVNAVPIDTAASLVSGTPGSFATVSVAWIPKRDYSTTNGDFPMAQLIFDSPAREGVLGATAYIDTLTVEVVRPTLVDRRGFIRTRTHSMGPAITADVGATIGDTLIRAHMKTPMRGDLVVTGRGGVRRYKGGASIDPFELGQHTGELIHFANEIDPDTGKLGRDGEISTVSYNGDEESAAVAIDSTRENFEAVMSRYELVVGGG